MHTDLSGKITPAGINNENYCQLLLYDRSGEIWSAKLKENSDANRTAPDLIKNADKCSGSRVSSIRTDSGKEFVSSELLHTFIELGIHFQRTSPYYPESNRYVER